MTVDFIFDRLESVVRFCVPILAAAMAGIFSEKSGTINISLEGGLLLCAFAAACLAPFSPMLGLATGLICGVVYAMTYATCVAHFRADAIVVGTGFNLLAASLTVFLSIAFFGSQSGTAVLEVNQKFHPLLWGQYAIGFIVLLLPLLSYWIYKNTAWGLRMRAAGENPTQLKSLGFSLTGVRFSALLATGICLGLGGSYLSLCMNSGFIKNMSAGMGFLGLAALICGAWRPLPTLFFALLFSFVDVLQTEIASHEYSFGRVPSSLSQSFPYIIGLIVLVIMGQKSGAPKALGEHE